MGEHFVLTGIVFSLYHLLLLEMVVLGSRSHYCINPALKKAVNKNDGCQDLLDDKGCLWKHNVRELEIRSMGKIWDMEDMIANGKSKRGMSGRLLRGGFSSTWFLQPWRDLRWSC